MCGHVGLAGSMARKDIDVFTDLLHFDTLRGPHSTGVAVVDRNFNNPGIKLLKRVGPAHQLMEHKEFDRLVGMGNSVIIGHNRHATVGKINTANAHPFEFEHIVGAHNGTIPYSERESIIDGDKFDTDSEGIFNMINDLGIEMTVPALFGAWALVWYDRREKTINMLRNDERELYYTFSESMQTVYWASEHAMLHAALMRRGIDYGKVIALRPDIHYRFEIPDTWNGKFSEPDESRIEGRKTATPSKSYYDNARFPSRQDDKKTTEKDGKDKEVVWEEIVDARDLPFGGNTEQSNWAKPSFNTHNKGRSNERLIPILLTFKQVPMNEHQYKNATKETCAHCDTIINFSAVHSEEDKIKFINPNQFLCEICGDDDWLEEWFENNERTSAYK